MKRPSLGERYGLVAIFIVVAGLYFFIVSGTLLWQSDDRKSVVAFFTIPVSIALLFVAAFGTKVEGRAALVVSTAAFGFVPAIGLSTWTRIEAPFVLAPKLDLSEGVLPAFLGVAAFVTLAAAAPWVIGIERPLDRIVRIVAPVVIVAEVAMFAVAIAHARRPDTDRFISTLPAPQPVPGEGGERLKIGGKELRDVRRPSHRDSCVVMDEGDVAYTDELGCAPATATFDEVTGMIFVHKDSYWSSSKPLRPSQLGKRLAAPVGWTHLAPGGAFLASIALVIASVFARRARAIDDPGAAASGGYRVPAPTPTDAHASAHRRDVYEARARGARLVALTVAASTALPLAAALAHGLGR